MASAPRELKCVKESGQTVGIGIKMDNEDRASNVILVAYVEEGSMFHGKIEKDDEIVTINGKDFRGDAKAASKAILEASTLTMTVRDTDMLYLSMRSRCSTSACLLTKCFTGADAKADDGSDCPGPQKEGLLRLTAPRVLIRFLKTVFSFASTRFLGSVMEWRFARV